VRGLSGAVRCRACLNRAGPPATHPAERMAAACPHRRGRQLGHLRAQVPRRGPGNTRPVADYRRPAGQAPRLRRPSWRWTELDPKDPPSEPDPELQDLLRASVGLISRVDSCPARPGFDRSAGRRRRTSPASCLWFAALIQNVDRSSWRPETCWSGTGKHLRDRPRGRRIDFPLMTGPAPTRPKHALQTPVSTSRDAHRIEQAHREAGPADGGGDRKSDRQTSRPTGSVSAAPTTT